MLLSLTSWWRHLMETFSALLTLRAGNSPVTGEFPSQRPVTRSFDLFFDLRLNNGGVNNRGTCDWRRHRAHYDVIGNLNALWSLLQREIYWNSYRTQIWRNLVGPKRTQSTTAILSSSVQNFKISKTKIYVMGERDFVWLVLYRGDIKCYNSPCFLYNWTKYH